jgi:hypothetical protein
MNHVQINIYLVQPMCKHVYTKQNSYFSVYTMLVYTHTYCIYIHVPVHTCLDTCLDLVHRMYIQIHVSVYIEYKSKELHRLGFKPKTSSISSIYLNHYASSIIVINTIL